MAELLGANRRAVRRWIEQGVIETPVAEPRYKPRPPVVAKLEPYKGLIEARLAAYPALSAVRLFEEARAAGYTEATHSCASL